MKYKRRTTRPSFEQLGMIANLPKLHDQVHEIVDLRLGCDHLEEISDGESVFDELVELGLAIGHLA